MPNQPPSMGLLLSHGHSSSQHPLLLFTPYPGCLYISKRIWLLHNKPILPMEQLQVILRHTKPAWGQSYVLYVLKFKSHQGSPCIKMNKLIKALNRVYPWSLVYNDLPTEAGWYGWAPIQCLSNFNKQGKLLALICTYTMYKSLGYETLGIRRKHLVVECNESSLSVLGLYLKLSK